MKYHFAHTRKVNVTISVFFAGGHPSHLQVHQIQAGPVHRVSTVTRVRLLQMWIIRHSLQQVQRYGMKNVAFPSVNQWTWGVQHYSIPMIRYVTQCLVRGAQTCHVGVPRCRRVWASFVMFKRMLRNKIVAQSNIIKAKSHLAKSSRICI